MSDDHWYICLRCGVRVLGSDLHYCGGSGDDSGWGETKLDAETLRAKLATAEAELAALRARRCETCRYMPQDCTVQDAADRHGFCLNDDAPFYCAAWEARE